MKKLFIILTILCLAKSLYAVEVSEKTQGSDCQITITFTEKEKEIIETQQPSIFGWVENWCNVYLDVCLDRAVLGNTNMNPKKMNRSEKMQELDGITLESAVEKGARLKRELKEDIQ